VIARRTVVLTAALLSMALVLGCGGDDDTEPAASATEQISLETSSLDRNEFLKRAIAICRREKAGRVAEVGDHMRELAAKGLPADIRNVRTVEAVMKPIVEAQIAGISQLGAPAGDEAELEAALSAQQEALDEVTQEDRIAVKEMYDHFADATRRLSAYGLAPCQFG
jgi:hypothetical protein